MRVTGTTVTGAERAAAYPPSHRGTSSLAGIAFRQFQRTSLCRPRAKSVVFARCSPQSWDTQSVNRP